MDSAVRTELSSYRRKPDGKSMHCRIVRELGLRIVSGEIKPGERLPSEATLLEAYDEIKNRAFNKGI